MMEKLLAFFGYKKVNPSVTAHKAVYHHYFCEEIFCSWDEYLSQSLAETLMVGEDILLHELYPFTVEVYNTVDEVLALGFELTELQVIEAWPEITKLFWQLATKDKTPDDEFELPSLEDFRQSLRAWMIPKN